MGYHQLTYRERYLIGRHKSSGESMRSIARMLGRSVSTISRELRRNVDRSDGCYRVEKAHRYARARRWRSRMGSQFEPAQVELVHELMGRKWSPEQISRRLGKLKRLSIGTTTIYRWVRRDKAAGGSLWLRTRQLGKRYRKGYRVDDHRGRMRGKTPISQRPESVELRREFGHWEGDTVMGKDGRHCVLTLVERKTRWVRIVKLPARQAGEVNKALATEIRRGVLKMKSLTLDNGTEFHGFKQLQEEFGVGAGPTRTPMG